MAWTLVEMGCESSAGLSQVAMLPEHKFDTETDIPFQELAEGSLPLSRVQYVYL